VPALLPISAELDLRRAESG